MKVIDALFVWFGACKQSGGMSTGICGGVVFRCCCSCAAHLSTLCNAVPPHIVARRTPSSTQLSRFYFFIILMHPAAQLHEPCCQPTHLPLPDTPLPPHTPLCRHDPLFMPQIISSAIMNSPPPFGVVKMLMRTNVAGEEGLSRAGGSMCFPAEEP